MKLQSGDKVEVGGKGTGKVDLLKISQAKHIWCIYTQIKQKHKKLAKEIK